MRIESAKIHHMKNLWALVFYLAAAMASAEEVYREVGEDGVPVFSDQGRPGSKPVEIREPMTFSDPLAKQRIQQEKKEEVHILVEGGVVEVNNNTVNVLVEKVFND